MTSKFTVSIRDIAVLFELKTILISGEGRACILHVSHSWLPQRSFSQRGLPWAINSRTCLKPSPVRWQSKTRRCGLEAQRAHPGTLPAIGKGLCLGAWRPERTASHHLGAVLTQPKSQTSPRAPSHWCQILQCPWKFKSPQSQSVTSPCPSLAVDSKSHSAQHVGCISQCHSFLLPPSYSSYWGSQPSHSPSAAPGQLAGVDTPVLWVHLCCGTSQVKLVCSAGLHFEGWFWDPLLTNGGRTRRAGGQHCLVGSAAKRKPDPSLPQW